MPLSSSSLIQWHLTVLLMWVVLYDFTTFPLQYKLGTSFAYCIYMWSLPRSVYQFTFTLLNDWHRKFTGISSQYISLASIPCWFMKWSAPFFRNSFLLLPLTTKSQSRPVSRQAKTNIWFYHIVFVDVFLKSFVFFNLRPFKVS